MGECRQQKHTQHAPTTKTECDYLNGWIKKRSHMQKSHPKVVNPRDIAGEQRRRRSYLHGSPTCSQSVCCLHGQQLLPEGKLNSLNTATCGFTDCLLLDIKLDQAFLSLCAACNPKCWSCYHHTGPCLSVMLFLLQ